MSDEMEDAPPAILASLAGKIWHATNVTNFEAIVADGFIRATPPVNRHANSFCQHLSRVSLFDFRDAPKLMEAVKRYDWTSFLRIAPDDMAVWLRIAPERITVPSASSLLVEWKAALDAGAFAGGRHSRIIADLETGYPGNIPTSALADVLLIGGLNTEAIPLDSDAVARARSFREKVGAKQLTGFAAAMAAAERRATLI